MMSHKYPFSSNGKEVLLDGKHYADAVDERAASHITAILNKYWYYDEEK